MWLNVGVMSNPIAKPILRVTVNHSYYTFIAILTQTQQLFYDYGPFASMHESTPVPDYA